MKGGQVLSEHPLPPGAELVVGRSDGCDVTIADGSVSRLHARLVGDGEGVYVEDLGSANGTFVDGTRARGRVRLADGQEVRAAQRAHAAPFVLRFQEERELPSPPAPSPAPNQPLWRMTSPDEVPAFTVPVTESPRPAPPEPEPADDEPLLYAPVAVPPFATGGASPPTAASAVRSRRSWLWGLLGLGLLVALGLASLAAWRFLHLLPRGEETRPVPSVAAATAPPPASPTTAPASTRSMVPAAATAPSPATEVLVVPDGQPTTEVSASAASSPAAIAAHPLAGKWAARLENVFYPEDDYVIELRLDLQQRGGEVSGSSRIDIEGKAMTFGVPATTVSGTIRRGASPWAVSLRLPFGRPIGELQLEGTLDGDALAGTFRSSAAKQPGAWQAVRSQP